MKKGIKKITTQIFAIIGIIALLSLAVVGAKTIITANEVKAKASDKTDNNVEISTENTEATYTTENATESTTELNSTNDFDVNSEYETESESESEEPIFTQRELQMATCYLMNEIYLESLVGSELDGKLKLVNVAYRKDETEVIFKYLFDDEFVYVYYDTLSGETKLDTDVVAYVDSILNDVIIFESETLNDFSKTPTFKQIRAEVDSRTEI